MEAEAEGWEFIERRAAGTRRETRASAFDGERTERDSVFLFLEQLNPHFSVFQAGFANLQEFVSFFEFRQQLRQWHVAGFHGFHNGFELTQGIFEREGLIGFGVHALNLSG